jgi:pyruvate/2-oxoglutarate dehydrogenase complex dihydrolipoamide dehydrogenase (E3) component
VPFCLFLEPELARIGLNEVEAKRPSNATWVKAGLPAQSPIAHTAGAVVSSPSFTLT